MALTTSQLYSEAQGQLESLLPKIQEKLGGPQTPEGEMLAEEELADEVPQEDTMTGTGELEGSTYADRRLQAAQSALKNQRNLRDPVG
jgi:hypothetical protein|tara:strand:- start:479 stop:742 length:264 start_codon:yes stop_codon:yes gene_type:complete